MKRILYTVLACAVFLTMLTGTPKKRRPREAGSIPKLTAPVTTGWQRTEVAGIRIAAPPNATVTRADDVYALEIRLERDRVFRFEKQVFDLPQLRSEYPVDFLMLDAPDAFIVLIETSGGNDFCRVVACSAPVNRAPLCVDTHAYANEQCAQVVAIVRSIQPL